jgi:mRNA interferase MazF
MTSSPRSPIRRGDIWMIDLKPQGQPEEPSKLRPCLVMQEDAVNAVHATIIVVPISPSAERSYPIDDPVRIHIGAFATEAGGAATHSWALADCIRSVSKRRVVGNSPLATCPVAAMKKLETALKVLLRLR